MNRHRHAAAAIAATVCAVALLGIGFSLFRTATATVTLTAAPAGHISPAGEVQAALGSRLSVTVWSDDPQMTPALLVGAQGVEPTPDVQGRYTYTVIVTGDISVQASFIQLADNVRVLPAGAGQDVISVSSNQDQVVFRDGSAFVTHLAVDDILANSQSSGYTGRLLVRITAIHDDGVRTIAQTEPVPFTAAIVKASIRARIPLLFRAAPTSQPTVQIGPPSVHADDVIDKGFTLSLAHTFESAGSNGSAAATLAGSMTLAATAEVNIDVQPKVGLTWPPIQGEVKLFEVALSESARASASLDAEVHAHLAEATTLLEQGLPGVWVSVFFIEPKLELGAGVDLLGDGHLNVSGSLSETVRVGMRYADGSWSPIDEVDTAAHGSVLVSASATARLYPTLRLAATVDKACTPYIEVQPGFLELDADIQADPWWKLDAGLNAAGGVDCFFGKWELARGDVARTTVAHADGTFLASSTQTSPPIAAQSARPVPSLPPTPVVSATLPADVTANVVSCPADSPGDLQPITLGPTQLGLHPTIDPGVAVSAYAFAYGFPLVIAPSGWKCSATVSQNGANYDVTVTSPSDPHESIHRTVSVSNGDVFTMACQSWPDAASLNPFPRDTCPPLQLGETFNGKHKIQLISPNAKEVVTPQVGTSRGTFLTYFERGSPAFASNTECVEIYSQHWCALAVETYLNPPPEWSP